MIHFGEYLLKRLKFPVKFGLKCEEKLVTVFFGDLSSKTLGTCMGKLAPFVFERMKNCR